MPNPFVHLELHVQDADPAKDFYSSLFDWKLEDVPFGEGTYTMIQPGDGPGGGLMKDPSPDTPPHWLAYVAVEDVDAATDRAQELGAKVIAPRMDIEGGSFTVIADPAGAALGLWQAASGGS